MVENRARFLRNVPSLRGRLFMHEKSLLSSFVFVEAALCETALSRVPRRHQLTDEKVVPLVIEIPHRYRNDGPDR